MTLREAYNAGDKKLPVVHNGIKYKRILRCGYAFTGQGEIIPYAEMQSYEDRSITVARVDTIELWEEAK